MIKLIFVVDCGQEQTLKPGDVIQCRECGYRILYKKRTRRMLLTLTDVLLQLFSMKHAEKEKRTSHDFNADCVYVAGYLEACNL
ncbi:hypothetical protein RHMOL_Rhmol04G0050800 [Rhododendron molle]|uniref:Uncharacterized protein n=1 Tax=Rhododendron molle TaxID=49168 RepID=A0ACC0NYT6_RHOML|nr:hypothetical protein RHMOL_Rhmol04G0050800 [Rhododendron molle]